MPLFPRGHAQALGPSMDRGPSSATPLPSDGPREIDAAYIYTYLTLPTCLRWT